MRAAAYQGVDGAYSQLALEYYLRTHGVEAETLGVQSFRTVATNVASGRAAVGIVPMENAIGGGLREGYDLLSEFDLAPIAELLWRTDHRLLGIKDATLAGVRDVLAHPLIIAECGKFLSSLGGVRPIPCEDTGVAAREVARSGNLAIAAIAPPAAAVRYDLIELASNISDFPNNFTRFLLFRPRQILDAEVAKLGGGGSRKTSVIFSVHNTIGALSTVLQHLAQAGISLSKLESKPRLGSPSDGVFYMDFDADIALPDVAQAMEQMKRDTASLQILGSYDAHRSDPIGANDKPVRAVAVPVAHDSWTPQLPEAAQTSWPRVARPARPEGSRLKIGPVTVGDGEFVVIAGPCSIESREQMLDTARAVHGSGAVMLRGGAFKPRTSPYAFQGLGWEAVSIISEAGRATGMPTVSEVMSIDQVERMAGQIDILQIGARNMQNFDLLRAVGRTGHPVLLKRGMSASIDELLNAAEYILAEGNPNVILCERGIRTFETATRNTLDLSAVPVLRERSHLPVVVDPSHGVGVSRWVRALCRAAKAVGAHGIIIEVHPNPPEAKSDKEQALTFSQFDEIMRDLERIPSMTEFARA